MRRALCPLIVAIALCGAFCTPLAHAESFGVGDSYAAIKQAARRWRVSYWWLVRVATCESGMRPYAYNPSGASGLAQFMPGTYWAYAAQIGERRSYWNPYAAANVMAFMFSRNQAYQWSCN